MCLNFSDFLCSWCWNRMGTLIKWDTAFWSLFMTSDPLKLMTLLPSVYPLPPFINSVCNTLCTYPSLLLQGADNLYHKGDSRNPLKYKSPVIHILQRETPLKPRSTLIRSVVPKESHRNQSHSINNGIFWSWELYPLWLLILRPLTVSVCFYLIQLHAYASQGCNLNCLFVI